MSWQRISVLFLATMTLQRALLVAATWDNADIQDAMANLNDEAIVRRVLLGGTYDRKIRPVLNASAAVDVKISVALQKVIDIDITVGIAKLSVWLRASWYDPRLDWNSTQHGGLSEFTASIDEVWTPDWLAYNSVETFEDNVRHEESNLYIYADGWGVYWSRPAVIKVSMSLVLQEGSESDIGFPFDTQRIKLIFGSWSNNGHLQDLNILPYSVHLGDGGVGTVGDGTVEILQVHSGEWSITSRPATRVVNFYACCAGVPWPVVTFYVDAKRKPDYYIRTIMVPIVCTTFVSFTTFLLPHSCGERFGLGITCVLAVFASMFVSSSVVPPTESTTALGKLYTVCFFYTWMSLVISVITRCVRRVRTEALDRLTGSIIFLNGDDLKGRWHLLSEEFLLNLSRSLDAFCAITFPLSFACVCVALMMPRESIEYRICVCVTIVVIPILFLFIACCIRKRIGVQKEASADAEAPAHADADCGTV